MKKFFSLTAAIVWATVNIISVSAKTVTYTPLGVPNVNSSVKTYMDYRAVSDTYSAQYKFINKWSWTDYDGFMRCNGEFDLGIADNYYLVALGSFYGTEIGTKYRITTDTGRQFYCVLADCKNDLHTNETHQYAGNYNIVEFLVDTQKLIGTVSEAGSANVYMPLNGSVINIERIDFGE